MQRATQAPIALAITAAFLLGCRSSDIPIATGPRDSAGVAILEFDLSAPSIREWHLDSSGTRIAIGEKQGIVSWVKSAVRFPSGVIGLSSDDDPRITILDSLGRRVAALGRSGEGPGEFRDIPKLFTLGDTLVAIPGRQRTTTISRWNTDLELISEQPITSPPFHSWNGPVGMTASGISVFMASNIDREKTGPFRAQTAILVVRPGMSEATPFLELAGDDRFGLGTTNTFVAFGKLTVATASGNLIHTGTNDPFEIKSWNTDVTLVRIVRFRAPPIRIDAAARTRFDSLLLARAAPETQRMVAQFVTQMKYADVLRPYDLLLPTAAGGLWIRRSRIDDHAAQVFLLLDTSGNFEGSITLPNEMRPLWIGADEILVEREDPNGASVVGRFGLRASDAEPTAAAQ